MLYKMYTLKNLCKDIKNQISLNRQCGSPCGVFLPSGNHHHPWSGEKEPCVCRSLHGTIGHCPHGSPSSASRVEGGCCQHSANPQRHPVYPLHSTPRVSGQHQLRQETGQSVVCYFFFDWHWPNGVVVQWLLLHSQFPTLTPFYILHFEQNYP